MSDVSDEPLNAKAAREAVSGAASALASGPGRLLARVKSLLGLNSGKKSLPAAGPGTQVALAGAKLPAVPGPMESSDEAEAVTSAWAARAMIWTFLAFVAAPTLAAMVYFGFICSDEYVAETRISIRAASEQKQQLSEAMSAFSKLGLSAAKSSIQDAYIIFNYAKSKPIIEDVGGRKYIESLFSHGDVDYFSRLEKDEKLETVWKYWNKHVMPSLDSLSGIVTIKVHGFTPAESKELAGKIVEACEKLVNQISLRSRSDARAQARTEVESAQEKLIAARGEMLGFRNRNATIDPIHKAEDIAKLIAGLTLKRIELQTLMAGTGDSLLPSAPSVRLNRGRLEEMDRQIEKLTQQLTAIDSSAQTVSKELSEYERLKLTEVFAEKLYQMSVLALERSEQEARRQQLYLSTVVEPTLPEKPLYPERITSILLAFTCAFVVWGIGVLLAATIFDHLS